MGRAYDIRQVPIQQTVEEYAPKVRSEATKVVERKQKKVVEKIEPIQVETEQLEEKNVLIIEEPDIGDFGYLALREHMSGIMIMGIFIIGVLTIITRKKVKEKIKSWLS